VRSLVYLLLVAAACLLLPGALWPRPGWEVASQARAAEDGRYRQRLLPGESRTYVLDLAAHSLLKVQFKGAGAGMGLRIQDAGDGRSLRLEDLPGGGRSWRGLLNAGDAPRSLRLTVHRAGGLGVHREVRRACGPLEEPAGTYDLELVRDALP